MVNFLILVNLFDLVSLVILVIHLVITKVGGCLSGKSGKSFGDSDGLGESGEYGGSAETGGYGLPGKSGNSADIG